MASEKLLVLPGGCPLQGIARTQSATIKNYALKLPTFGAIVGVNHSGVQWNSLTLGELPC